MIKSVKRNKAKVWCKTYGRPFISRRAITTALMARDAAMAIHNVNLIMATAADKSEKKIAVAKKTLEVAEMIANKSKLLNKGFVKND